MKSADLIKYRLGRQQIASHQFNKPEEIVSWLGALQAQEYAMAKWAIALRLPLNKTGMLVCKDADVEKSFNEGAILRTHLLRPTWHFVSPADIRWLLKLTAPRIHAANANTYREYNFDAASFKKSNAIISKALEGQKQHTRDELKQILEQKKIKTDGIGLICLLMFAELEGVICSGPRKGKQFTYALLDERVPAAKSLTRDEALLELTKRYFTSRGPATAQDFSYWSGLTLKDIKQGINLLEKQLQKESIADQDYYFIPEPGTGKKKPTASNNSDLNSTFLMADYDEYLMSYKDRSSLSNLEQGQSGLQNLLTQGGRGNITFNRMFVIDGKVAGTWKRTLGKDKVMIELVPFKKLKKAAHQNILKAAQLFADFVGLKADVQL